MASLKNIKLKIQSYKKTGTVTHAMEAVSAVKMRKAQERALNGRAYAAAALSVLERLAGTVDLSHHPLMSADRGPASVNSSLKSCFIVVTSDKGLAGSLNSSIIRRVEAEIVMSDIATSDIVMIAIGRRGAEYFASRGYDVRERFENLSDDVSQSDIRKVTELVMAWHKAGEIGKCMITYTNFISTFEQQAVVRQIVPITPEGMRTIVSEIRPVRGKYAPQASEQGETLLKAPAAYTIEPDADSVLAVILPQLLNVAIFHAVLESKASEHSARRVAMKNATDKAKEMAHAYTRQFNKARQAAITREVSEITSGMEAMK